ncbi:MAG: DUF3025 domain-containing protein, partial [Polyangiaceae bacterium]|nr:DUF3025 domain-containing protein [Polyangiaceae bacterium]
DEVLAPAAGVRFVESPPLPRRRRRAPNGAGSGAGSDYDARIVREGVVPTRPGSLHDLMNALVWAAFPRAKAAVHARQLGFVERARAEGTVGRRTKAHDALAILDEGGVLVAAREPLGSEAELEAALVRGTARHLVFGHGIYESLAIDGPRPLVGALVVAWGASWPTRDDDLRGALDLAVKERLEGDRAPTAPQDYLRVPVPTIWSA